MRFSVENTTESHIRTLSRREREVLVFDGEEWRTSEGKVVAVAEVAAFHYKAFILLGYICWEEANGDGERRDGLRCHLGLRGSC